MTDPKCTHALDEVCWSERDTYTSKGILVAKRAIPVCTHKADANPPTPSQDERDAEGIPPVWFDYEGEGLNLYWRNPFDGSPFSRKAEKIASFWWPAHPPEDTERVEKWFERIAARACGISARETQSEDRSLEKMRVYLLKYREAYAEDLFTPIAEVQKNDGSDSFTTRVSAHMGRFLIDNMIRALPKVLSPKGD
jgi:hypothetical protein